MKKYIRELPTLKEIERDLFRTLQATFSDVLQGLLEEMDQRIAETRDKRPITIFGSMSMKRNYYIDRMKNKYVSLLDHYLVFEGSKGFSRESKKWPWN